MPGEEVQYTVTVSDSNNQRQDAYVSITVTDDSVFQQLEERKQPPSFAARLYIENEIYK